MKIPGQLSVQINILTVLKHMPVLKAALQNHRSAQSATPAVARLADPA